MPLCRERTGRFFIISLQSTTLPLVWMNHFLRFANRSSRKLRPCHLTMTTYRNLRMLESGQTGNSTVKKMRSIAKGILFFITYLSLPSQKDRMIGIGAHIGGLAIEICWKLLKTCQRLMLLALYIFQKRWATCSHGLVWWFGAWFRQLSLSIPEKWSQAGLNWVSYRNWLVTDSMSLSISHECGGKWLHFFFSHFPLNYLE